jgi:hypothetical protein
MDYRAHATERAYAHDWADFSVGLRSATGSQRSRP